jgi:tripartite-type tricarboxylate transporter receptor subunit TctC
LLIAFRTLLLCTAILLPLHAQAQDRFPTKPVRIIVPFPAGSTLDLLARLSAQSLAEQWSSPVVVENRAGGSGSIGADAVAKAAPDGYTLMVTVDLPLTMYPAIAKQLPYNPRTDFKPIGVIARTGSALFVNTSVKANSVAELIALAKASPGKLTFSSGGAASPGHFAGELFSLAAGVDMLHVPYKGSAPAIAAAASGEVSLMFGPIGQGAAQVAAGKFRPLAVTDHKPSPLLPGIKPFTELGFPGLAWTSWFPMMAPARTPEPVAVVIRTALKRAIEQPAIHQKLTAVDMNPGWEGPEEVTRQIDSDMKRWAEVARRAKIEPM